MLNNADKRNKHLLQIFFNSLIMHRSWQQEVSYQKKRKAHQNGEKEFPTVVTKYHYSTEEKIVGK